MSCSNINTKLRGEVSTLKLSCWSAPNRLSGLGRCLRRTKVETLASGATDSSIQYFRRLFCTLNKGEEQGEKGKSMETLNMNLVLAQGCWEGSRHLWDHDAYNPDPSARRGRARRRQSVFTPQSAAANATSHKATDMHGDDGTERVNISPHSRLLILKPHRTSASADISFKEPQCIAVHLSEGS